MKLKMINIVRQINKLEKEFDDIVWENGIDDPRLTFLAKELKMYREMDANGEAVEPPF